MRSSLRRSLALRVRSALCAAIVVVAPASAFAQTGATEAGAGKGAIVEAKTESGVCPSVSSQALCRCAIR